MLCSVSVVGTYAPPAILTLNHPHVPDGGVAAGLTRRSRTNDPSMYAREMRGCELVAVIAVVE